MFGDKRLKQSIKLCANNYDCAVVCTGYMDCVQLFVNGSLCIHIPMYSIYVGVFVVFSLCGSKFWFSVVYRV